MADCAGTRRGRTVLGHADRDSSPGLPVASGSRSRASSPAAGWRLVIDARERRRARAARAELADTTEVVAIAGDVADAAHRRRSSRAAGDGSTCS